MRSIVLPSGETGDPFVYDSNEKYLLTSETDSA